MLNLFFASDAKISHTEVYPLSAIIALTFDGRLSPEAIRTVAAPIDEPCNIISEFSFCSTINFIHTCKSSLSNQPIPIYFPSLSPQPLMFGISTLYPSSEKCSPIVKTDFGLERYPCNTIAHLLFSVLTMYSVPFSFMPSFAVISTFFCSVLLLHSSAFSVASFLFFCITSSAS